MARCSITTHGMHGVRFSTIVIPLSRGFIPRGDIRGFPCNYTGAPRMFLACDKRSGGTENGVQMRIDDGLDVDRVISRAGVDKRNEYTKGDAEHGSPRAAEVGSGFAGPLEGLSTRILKREHTGEENDVFAIELQARGVHLEVVWVGRQAFVK